MRLSRARRGARARLGERVGVVEQLAERLLQALDVTRRDDPAGSEGADDLAEPADVVDDRRDACADRLQQRAGLVELGAVREDGDRRRAERALDLARRQVAEAPLGAIAGALRAARRAGSADRRRRAAARSGTPSDGLDGVGEALVRPDHPEREHGAAVVGAGRIAAEGGVGDDAELARGDAERLERRGGRARCG